MVAGEALAWHRPRTGHVTEHAAGTRESFTGRFLQRFSNESQHIFIIFLDIFNDFSKAFNPDNWTSDCQDEHEVLTAFLLLFDICVILSDQS